MRMTLCRCCLGEDAPCRDLFSIYEWVGEKEVYTDMLMESFNIALQASECAEAGICEGCVLRLRDATGFKRQVLRLEGQFRQRIVTVKEERAESSRKVSDCEDAYDNSDRDDAIEVDDKEDVKDILPLSTFVKKSGRSTKRASKSVKVLGVKKTKIKDEPGSSRVRDKNPITVKKDPVNIYNGCEPPGDWTTGELKRLKFTKTQDFTAEIGPEPIDYFTFFVDEDFLLLICTETNLYAEKVFKESWVELTVEELKIFLGLLLHMGTIKLKKLQDCWKSTRLFNIPIFKEQMSEGRFFVILRCLRFASDLSGDDPLEKIREVTYYFNEKMDRSYYPGRDLSLDGTIISKCRLKPLSRNRKYTNAVKFYTLKEADGTVLRICVDGKGGIEDIERCVLNLMEGKMNNGHTLYTNSYFNSYNLAKNLLENGTHCTGYLKVNVERNAEETLKKGQRKSTYNGGVHVGKWKDKNAVTYLTTEHKTKKLKFAKPQALRMYEKHVSERNSSDETYAFYPFQSTTLRWYKKVFIHALQLLLINAHRFYNRYSGANMSFGEFRISVIDALLPETNPNIPSASVTVTTKALVAPPANVNIHIVRSTTTHTVSKIEERSSSGRTKRKMCRLCSKSGKRADSVYHCVQCYGQPGLCLTCFDIFHTMSEQ